jgi:hypothetical protein
MRPIYNEGLEKIKKSYILSAFPPSPFSVKTFKDMIISLSWENNNVLLDTLAHIAIKVYI